MIEALERITLDLWPPAQRETYDGWELVSSGGYTRRTNSVQPLADGVIAPDDKLEHCRRYFETCGLRTVYKLTAAARPAGLDAALAARGFARGGETSVQVCNLAAAPIPAVDPNPEATDVHIVSDLDDAWFESCVRLNGVSGNHRDALQGILRRLPPGSGFASIRDLDADPDSEGRASEPLALALGSVGSGRMYIGEVVTASHARRRGCARRLMVGLMGWARARAVHTAYLGVVVDNAPAHALYADLGFREAYRYWYRESGS